MKRLFCTFVLAAAALSSNDAGAAETSLALGSVEAPPSSGVDRATLRTTAEGELLGVDASRLKSRRKIIVSVALIGTSDAPVACTVNATLHDGKSGTLLAIIEGRARSESNSASAELRKAVLRVAVRNAVRQIPEALSASK
ncbi:MAG: hypothetical protein KF819_17535 [Labilithrix sp.]|nr:hypothetical protein [Labilithrix sp.]